jgi:hypothetical protein
LFYAIAVIVIVSIVSAIPLARTSVFAIIFVIYCSRIFLGVTVKTKVSCTILCIIVSLFYAIAVIVVIISAIVVIQYILAINIAT